MVEPKYLRAQRSIKQLCRRADIDSKLPSEHELGKQLGVSRITIRRAIDSLSDAGIVERIQGSGTYIRRSPAPPPEIINPLGFYAQMSSRGHRIYSHVLFLDTVPADPTVARALACSPHAHLVRLVRLRTLDGSIHHYTTSWWDPEIAPMHSAETYQNRSLYDLFREHGLVLEREDVSVYLDSVPLDIAKLLEIAPNSARLVSDSVVHSNQGQALVFSRTIRKDETATVSFSISAIPHPLPDTP